MKEQKVKMRERTPIIFARKIRQEMICMLRRKLKRRCEGCIQYNQLLIL